MFLIGRKTNLPRAIAIESTEVRVLFENKDFIAVDKAPGISIHNNEDPQNLLLVLERQLKLKKLYPVHRLDKETSGVQVFALNENSARQLAEEFQNRSVDKIYVGILRGEIKHPEGMWALPLTDKAEGRKSPAGMVRDRIPCETGFQVIKANKYFTHCEFQLLTGRQHQIRKHAALANHSLVGDSRYGDPKYNQKIASIYGESRMFLHCARLEIAGQKLVSPTPESFAKLDN